jgi:hypothetical protein
VTTASETDPTHDPRQADALPDRAARGAEGNERLTAWTGASLFVGFAVEGYTILDVHWYLTWHIVIGFALLVPVALKISSTVYRFARYYTHSPAYVRRGPPRMLLRILGPFLILATLSVLLTGIAIMFAGDYRHPIEELHKLSFIAWFGLTAVHVLAYLWRVPRLMLADVLARGTARADSLIRIGLVGGAGLLGLGLAFALLPWVRTWIAG